MPYRDMPIEPWMIDLIKALIQVRQHTRKDGTMVRAHQRNILTHGEKKDLVGKMAAALRAHGKLDVSEHSAHHVHKAAVEVARKLKRHVMIHRDADGKLYVQHNHPGNTPHMMVYPDLMTAVRDGKGGSQEVYHEDAQRALRAKKGKQIAAEGKPAEKKAVEATKPAEPEHPGMLADKHLMTYAQYRQSAWGDLTGPTTVSSHKNAIREALKAGKEVPAHVMNEHEGYGHQAKKEIAESRERVKNSERIAKERGWTTDSDYAGEKKMARDEAKREKAAAKGQKPAAPESPIGPATPESVRPGDVIQHASSGHKYTVVNPGTGDQSALVYDHQAKRLTPRSFNKMSHTGEVRKDHLGVLANYKPKPASSGKTGAATLGNTKPGDWVVDGNGTPRQVVEVEPEWEGSRGGRITTYNQELNHPSDHFFGNHDEEDESPLRHYGPEKKSRKPSPAAFGNPTHALLQLIADHPRTVKKPGLDLDGAAAVLGGSPASFHPKMGKERARALKNHPAFGVDRPSKALDTVKDAMGQGLLQRVSGGVAVRGLSLTEKGKARLAEMSDAASKAGPKPAPKKIHTYGLQPDSLVRDHLPPGRVGVSPHPVFAHGAVEYDRELTPEEVSHYGLDRLTSKGRSEIREDRKAAEVLGNEPKDINAEYLHATLDMSKEDHPAEFAEALEHLKERRPDLADSIAAWEQRTGGSEAKPEPATKKAGPASFSSPTHAMLQLIADHPQTAQKSGLSPLMVEYAMRGEHIGRSQVKGVGEHPAFGHLKDGGAGEAADLVSRALSEGLVAPKAGLYPGLGLTTKGQARLAELGGTPAPRAKRAPEPAPKADPASSLAKSWRFAGGGAGGGDA
jgi:hypothetical protein